MENFTQIIRVGAISKIHIGPFLNMKKRSYLKRPLRRDIFKKWSGAILKLAQLPYLRLVGSKNRDYQIEMRSKVPL